MERKNRIDEDFEAFKLLVDLWTNENPIKTNKLQVLLVVNGLLVSAVQAVGGFVAENWPIYLVACVLSLIWVFSIGRTVLFQQIWKLRIQELRDRHPDVDRFQVLSSPVDTSRLPLWLRAAGGVSSKFYLIGAPFLFAAAWGAILAVTLIGG